MNQMTLSSWHRIRNFLAERATSGHEGSPQKSVSQIHHIKHDTESNAGLMLGQRLRRWPNFKPALSERPMFIGYPMMQQNTRVRLTGSRWELNWSRVFSG